MQRQRDESDNNNAPGNDLLGKFIKYAPIAAAAIGAGLATAYTVKEIRKLEAPCSAPMTEEMFYQNITREKRERSHLSHLITYFCSNGTDTVNSVNEQGFGPIHLACQTANISTLQAILPFRPNLGLKTGTGQTALELIQVVKKEKVEHQKELEVIEYILKVCDPHTLPPQWPELDHPQYNCYKITPPTLISHTPPGIRYVRGARVLCIDGGGTRGFVPLEFLDYIENWTPDITPPLPNQYKIIDYFDWITGTSTGGLIALYLALGHTVAECRNMYFNLKDKIFTGSRPYNASRFEDELKIAFGETTRMCDIPEKIRCVITTTTGSAEHLTRVLISNYDPKTKDEFIWKVARCTSAAPYFFDPYQDPVTKTYYYDGGLTANNPTLAVLTEINKVNAASLNQGILVSLGTGKPPESENLNLTVYRSPMSIATMVTTLFKTLINQVSKSDGEVVEEAMTICSLAKCFYYRMTPILPEAVLLDETDNEKLLNMIYHAKAYTNIFKGDLDEICLKLFSGMDRTGSCTIM